MRQGFLDGLDHMPVVIGPSGDVEASLPALLAWYDEHRTTMEETLRTHGAVLLRGFSIDGPGAFNTLVSQIGGPLQNYVGGDSPRNQVGDRVYTSTEFAPNLEIYLHNELSYSTWYPSRVFFHCRTASESGGQTTIGDSRRIYDVLVGEIADRFRDLGVAYLQNLHGGVGVGKSWQETYETDDRDVVEAHCREHGVEFEWTSSGLRTRTVRDAVIDHPVTAERVWFNQADQFHALAPGPRVDPGNAERFERGDWPCHATYGDGSEIAVADLMQIRSAFASQEVLFDWRPGDVLMLDNIIAAHGRKPYTGPREILVAMT